MASISQIQGVGLGLKRELIPQIQALYRQPEIANINFVEIAPENWVGVGGKSAKQLDWFVERYPIVCHGLCLSLGGLAPLNADFLKQVKSFLHQYQIPVYTEHLSYSTDGYKGEQGYLYDLLPIPFTEEAVHYVAKRIRQTQDILGQRIGIENASFYVAAPVSEMNELTFLKAVLDEADCLLTSTSITFTSIALTSTLTRMSFYAASLVNVLPIATLLGITNKLQIYW